jgi:hypothetical protein
MLGSCVFSKIQRVKAATGAACPTGNQQFSDCPAKRAGTAQASRFFANSISGNTKAFGIYKIAEIEPEEAEG